MPRRYGRARRGRRGAVPDGHRKTTTLVAALRHDGLTAALRVDDAINGARLLAHGEQALVPILRPGDLVVMDNLPPTRPRRARGDRGHRRPPAPPYGADLDPIEQLFAKLKGLLRTAAARTVEALRHTIGRLPDAFTPTGSDHHLAHAG